MTGGHFVTVISLDDNQLFMIKHPPVIDTILLNIDMKLTAAAAWRWSCSDKKIETNKKQHTNLNYWNGVKAK